MSEVIELKVRPVREMFFSEDTDFGIYACESDDMDKVKINKYGNFSMKGNTVRLEMFREYNATLKEMQDKKYGTYYEIQSLYEEIPTDVTKQKRYLAYILTDRQIEEIYKVYPDQDIITLIREDKFDFEKVKGIGKKTYQKIKDKIVDNLEYKEAMDFLGQYNIDAKVIVKLVKHFKSAKLLIKKISENPYNMLAVHGIGFKKADAIAMSMEYDPNGKHRIISAIEHVLTDQEKQGHTYTTIKKLVSEVEDLIGVDHKLIAEHVTDTEKYRVIGETVTLEKTYKAEVNVRDKLKQFLASSTELDFDVESFIRKQEKKLGITLTDQQKAFFYNVKKYGVNLLTGYAGCGKSQLQTLLIDLLEELGIGYVLLAPTGKAAKVLSAYTQREASTIHRAIGLGERSEEGNKMIEEEYVIVDETSMMDIKLASTLLNRIERKDARILFIGDPFQIPSVGCGNFLQDCVQSEVIPNTMLDIVFRQKEGGILDIVTKLRLGQKFIDNDFVGIQEFGDNVVFASVPQAKMEGGYQYFLNQVLDKYQPEDIMILSPTNKGVLGTVAINDNAQELLNPAADSKVEMKHGKDVVFRDGDYVINTKNTYGILNMREDEVNIVNGDSGFIKEINDVEKEVVVDFDFDEIPLSKSYLNNLLHSWCITKHRSQGSSSKVVIAIADKSHKYMINANLLYVAWTRAEELLIVLTQAETVNYAMRRRANLERRTYLHGLLMMDDTNEE